MLPVIQNAAAGFLSGLVGALVVRKVAPPAAPPPPQLPAKVSGDDLGRAICRHVVEEVNDKGTAAPVDGAALAKSLTPKQAAAVIAAARAGKPAAEIFAAAGISPAQVAAAMPRPAAPQLPAAASSPAPAETAGDDLEGDDLGCACQGAPVPADDLEGDDLGSCGCGVAGDDLGADLVDVSHAPPPPNFVQYMTTGHGKEYKADRAAWERRYGQHGAPVNIGGHEDLDDLGWSIPVRVVSADGVKGWDTWTDATRPTRPAPNTTGHNADRGYLETWNGRAWVRTGDDLGALDAFDGAELVELALDSDGLGWAIPVRMGTRGIPVRIVEPVAAAPAKVSGDVAGFFETLQDKAVRSGVLSFCRGAIRDSEAAEGGTKGIGDDLFKGFAAAGGGALDVFVPGAGTALRTGATKIKEKVDRDTGHDPNAGRSSGVITIGGVDDMSDDLGNFDDLDGDDLDGDDDLGAVMYKGRAIGTPKHTIMRPGKTYNVKSTLWAIKPGNFRAWRRAYAFAPAKSYAKSHKRSMHFKRVANHLKTKLTAANTQIATLTQQLQAAQMTPQMTPGFDPSFDPSSLFGGGFDGGGFDDGSGMDDGGMDDGGMDDGGGAVDAGDDGGDSLDGDDLDGDDLDGDGDDLDGDDLGATPIQRAQHLAKVRLQKERQLRASRNQLQGQIRYFKGQYQRARAAAAQNPALRAQAVQLAGMVRALQTALAQGTAALAMSNRAMERNSRGQASYDGVSGVDDLGRTLQHQPRTLPRSRFQDGRRVPRQTVQQFGDEGGGGGDDGGSNADEGAEGGDDLGGGCAPCGTAGRSGSYIPDLTAEYGRASNDGT